MKVVTVSETNPQYIIAGTGSRKLVLDKEKYLEMADKISVLLVEAKAEHGDNLLVISGMAEGFDEVLAGSALLEGVSLLAAIPNHGYGDYYWKRNSLMGLDRTVPFTILTDYARSTGGVHYVCNNIYENGKHSNFIRNEWMADRANIVWVYNPTSRGTKHCYEYCLKNDIKTHILDAST